MIYTVEVGGRAVCVTSADDIHDMDDAIDTWLGNDLQSLLSEGKSVWSGEKADIYVREAWPEEVAFRARSRQRAVDAGEQEPDDDD